MNWWSSFFRKKRYERELDRELRFHFDEQVRANLAAGLSPDEARRSAALEFGGLPQVKEECRDVRPSVWADQLMQDLRYAVRQLFQARGFAVTAILTIALGIGSCTALFSLVNSVLLRPLHFPESERIVTIVETRPPSRQTVGPAPAAYLDWVAQTTSFIDLAASAWRTYNVRLSGQMMNVSGQAVTANFFTVLKVEPVLGRNFRPEEQLAGQDRVALLSYSGWQTHFGGREDVLGQTILLHDNPYTIIGVVPDRNLVWSAFVFTPLSFSDAARADYGSHGSLGTVGRLKPGITLEQAQRDLDRVSGQIAQAHPESNQGHGALVEPLLDALTSNVRLQLILLLSAVGLVLLIAGVNVACLLLARATARQREIAVRAALGASRWRIMRQFLVESLLVSVAGGVLGVMAAYASLGAMARFAGTYVPRADTIALDGRVLAVTLGLMILTGCGVGLIPALQFTRGDLADPLKDAGRGSSDGRRRQRLRTVLVAVELALATMLLAGTGLLARSLMGMQRADQGFDPREVYHTNVEMGGKRAGSAQQVMAFVDAVTTRVGALPGVQAVALANGLPGLGQTGLRFKIDGTPDLPVRDMLHTSDVTVTPDFFKVMGIPLLRGRGFTAQDTLGSPRVIVVNQEMVRRHFPNTDPIGQRLMILTLADKPDAVREIVGVVGDIRGSGPQSKIGPQVYEPRAQVPYSGGMTMIIKAEGASAGLNTAVGTAIRSMGSDLPYRDLRPYQLLVANSWSRQRFTLILFALFSGLALLLAAIGIYGVMNYAVAQRTQEIGIRMALGARARDVLAMIFRGGARIVVIGLLLGIAGTVAFARVLRSLLFNVSELDPVNLGVVALLLAAVALVACLLPARRAAKVDPIIALRAE